MMPWELIHYTPVWIAAAAPPGAGAWTDTWEQEMLQDVILVDTCCSTALWNRVCSDPRPELPHQRHRNMGLGHSFGGERVVISISKADGSFKSRSVTEQCESRVVLRHKKAVRTSYGVNRWRGNLVLNQLWQLQILLIAIDCQRVLLDHDVNSSLAIKMCISTKIIINDTL